jgi:hypothetical protein
MKSQDISQKNMTVRDIIDKLLKVTELDINDLAIKCGIIPNTLTVAIRRGALGKEIVTKLHDNLGVKREFLINGIEPIFEENTTPANIKRHYGQIAPRAGVPHDCRG